MIVGETRLSTKLINLVNNCANYIHNRLLPASCVLCGGAGQPGLDLCKPCQIDLPRIPLPCPVCGMPLAADEQQVCGQCLREPPRYTTTLSPYAYAPPLVSLITQFKFNHRVALARVFAALLAQDLDPASPQPDCLIPVPLHLRRLRERGYNQSLEIARLLGNTLSIPVDDRLCQRTHYTAPQSGLSAKDRRRNIKKAFSLTGPCPYQHIAIVDDVITTGQTVSELAGLLRRHGAENIEVWSVARAVPD